MTTPRIPADVAQAAHAAAVLCRAEHPPTIRNCCIIAAIETALPELGTQEWAVHCRRQDHDIPAPNQTAAYEMAKWPNCGGPHTITTRFVTPWTDDTP